MLDICFVHLQPVLPDRSNFAAVVPIRMAQLLPDSIQLHVVYMGEIHTEALKKHGIIPHAYQGGLSAIPFLRYFGLAVFLARVGWKENIDLFQNVWFHYALYPIILGAMLSNAKVIARVVGVPISVARQRHFLGFLKNRLGLALEFIALRLVSHVHVISEYLKDTFRKRGVPAKKITVISTGCDTEQFRPGRKDDGSCEEPTRILYVGRIDPLKGIADLLRGYAKYRDEYRETNVRTELLVVGDGEERKMDQMRTLAANLGIGDVIDFLGHVEHSRLPKVYNEADIFALPSHGEGLGNAFLEAMACGLPCLGTSVGAIPELLSDDRGVLVSPKEPSEIALGLHHLIKDTSYRADLGRRARAYVVQEHSFESVRRKYVELYRNVLALQETEQYNSFHSADTTAQ